MKSSAFVGLALLCYLPTLSAAPVEDAIVAAMRLSERRSYSWVSTVDDDARTYRITGKTTPAGYALVQMPVANAIRRRLGRGATDNIVDAIFRGNVNCVVATEDGWKKIEELPVIVDPDPMLGGHSNALRGSLLPGSSGGRSGRPALVSLPAVAEKDSRAYSNLQMGVSYPHEELGVIVGTGKDLRTEGEALTGSLSDVGAQLLLVRDGQTEITPVRAAGTFTVWIRGGLVSRYQVNLEGVIAVKTKFGAREIAVHQSTMTVIKDVGTTRVDVPYEAEAKLAP
jgi:hypothetical protein